MKRGKDVWKYDKIYSRSGVMTKKVSGSMEARTYDDADESFRKKWNRYGHANEGSSLFGFILNVGCGWNEMVSELRKHGVENAVGLDCSCPGADVLASAHSMPFADKSFDLIISFDCMEHIPEEEIEETFLEFSRVCNSVLLKIALADTTTKIDGETLHPCVKPKEWWTSIAGKYFNIMVVGESRAGTPHESIFLRGWSK